VLWISIQLLSETFLILNRTDRVITKKYILVFTESLLQFVRFYWKLNYLKRFYKNYRIIRKLVQWEPRYTKGTDKRTDMTKLMVAFRNFAKAPKIWTKFQLFRVCVAEIRLCVLQTTVGSLQLSDCDTEWIICINVGTGVVLCRKEIIRI
jgi:hypothetical protein